MFTRCAPKVLFSIYSVTKTSGNLILNQAQSIALLFFSTHDITNTNNKTFWKTVKPLFTDKIQAKSKVTLLKKNLFLEKGKRKYLVTEKVISKD